MPLKKLIDILRAEPQESEWLEFKCSNKDPERIGKYLSALSNSACIENQRYGYIVWGIDDATHEVVGTSFKPHNMKKGNILLEAWLTQQLCSRVNLKIDEYDYDGKSVVLFRVDATEDVPVRFNGCEYIRIGSTLKALANYPEKAKLIWKNDGEDWSAQAVSEASLDDLDPNALVMARNAFKEKHKNDTFHDEIDEWDDWTLLRKAGLAVGEQLNRAAILLLGRPESSALLSPYVAQISWILKDRDGIEMDYQHFAPPFLTNVDRLFARIRNLTIRELPGGTLFPVEISQYDDRVIREALHNCIAHQDYTLCSKIIVVENPDGLLLVNAGRFIPGSVETVLKQDAPQKEYPNRKLTEIMVHLNMIDTIGSGIKSMFRVQKQRFMPMPDFDLSASDEVRVRVAGRILDENYSKLLMKQTDLALDQVILLDKVQKKQGISKNEAAQLRKDRLIEGRLPNIYVSSGVAQATGQKVKYTRNKAFDKQYYKDLILQFLEQHKKAAPEDIQSLVMDKLSDLLNEKQRKDKVRALLYEMSHKDKTIYNAGGRGSTACWKLVR